MADKKITQLDELKEADARAVDVAAVAALSANETRKITIPDLVKAGVRLMADGSIDGAKLEDDSVDADKLATDAVTTAAIKDDAVTADKIATGAVGADQLADDAVDTNAIEDDAVTLDKMADDSVDSDQIVDDAVGADQIADDAVGTAAIADDAVTGAQLDPTAFDRGLDLTNDKVGITNSIVAGTQAGISYNAQGLITGVTDPIPPADLPIATETTLGAVIVPDDDGIGVNGLGEIFIDNLVTADTKCKITYDIHGLVTAGADLEADDLPVATSTTAGAVIVPATDTDGDNTPLDIAANGSITHTEGGTAGTYTKCIVDKYGHVTSGTSLAGTDIPEISGDLITSGTIEGAVIGDDEIEARHLADYSTCLMQEDNPGIADFLGQLWFKPSLSQLYVYARGSGPQNMWMPVGFGVVQQTNLRWAGTYDASTSQIEIVTAVGISAGFTAGTAIPAASDTTSGCYFVCTTPGNAITVPNLTGVSHTNGDWIACVSEAQGWLHIDVTNDAGGGGGGGGGATRLTDLLDVEIGGASSPFGNVSGPRVALSADQILRYDGTAGLWRNTDIIDGGSID